MTHKDRFIGALRQFNVSEDRIKLMLNDVQNLISPEGLDPSYSILADFITLLSKTARRHYEAVPLIQIMAINLLSSLDKTHRSQLLVELLRFFFHQDTGLYPEDLVKEALKEQAKIEKPDPLRGYA